MGELYAVTVLGEFFRVVRLVFAAHLDMEHKPLVAAVGFPLYVPQRMNPLAT